MLLRILFTLLCLQALAVPFIKLACGLILLVIAGRLVGQEERAEKAPVPMSIWASIRIIIVADAVMSLDNVIAVAAAARGSGALIMIGLALSIPLVIFGATILITLLERFPFLVWIGGGILGWVAGDLIGSDPALADFLRSRASIFQPWQFAAAGAILALLCSWLRARGKVSGQRT